MSNQLLDLLTAWDSQKTETDWVLGTVFKTEGSAYRKAGAMMMISGLGERFGLLSGGCLEADITRNARRVMQTQRAITITYDGTDDDDLSYHLGIGCGGVVHILLQPVTPDVARSLSQVLACLSRRESGIFAQQIPDRAGNSRVEFIAGSPGQNTVSELREAQGETWFYAVIRPEPHLLIVGGGQDAQPVLTIARTLGWRVSVFDPRPANARPEHFPEAFKLGRDIGETMTNYAVETKVDAAVIMGHNMQLDAKALQSLQKVPLRYVALLGPRHRYHEVLDVAGLKEQRLSWPLSAPAGFDIGGRLPESIALSILSECHAVLHGKHWIAGHLMAAE